MICLISYSRKLQNNKLEYQRNPIKHTRHKMTMSILLTKFMSMMMITTLMMIKKITMGCKILQNSPTTYPKKRRNIFLRTEKK